MKVNSHNKRAIYEIIRGELKDLPGEKAHFEMYPERISAKKAVTEKRNYRDSSVLILLYQEFDELKFVLIERQEYLGQHAGQISLPGGKYEKTDKNLAYTALRETEEEIGVCAKNIELLGALTKIYIPISNFIVQPYIGFSTKIESFKPDVREVKTILHCPVSALLDDWNKIETEIIRSDKNVLKNVPAFMLEEKVVWGATAIILNEFKQILKRI